MPGDRTPTPEMRAWVARVLDVQFPAGASAQPAASATQATSASRAAEASAEIRPGAVKLGTLQLRWRDAQSRVETNLRQLAEALLAHPGVRQDPRFGQVKAVADGFTGLVPAFGGKLEDVLNDVMNAGRVSPDKAGEGAAAIAAYRDMLAKTPALLKLEGFAQAHFRLDMKAHSDLDATLASLGDDLSASAAPAGG